MANRTYFLNRYGFDYRLSVDDPIMEDRFRAGELCEQGMLDWIVANIPHGGIWIDAGANIGNHTQVFATACEADIVMAFEPVPENHDNLIANTAHLSNVIAPRLGVGCGPMLCEIIPTAQGRNCQFALKRSEGRPNTAVVSLDAIVPQDGVRLLKIDVEGAEYETLQGARMLIHRSKPEIFVEIWKQADLELIEQWLTMQGYVLCECYNHSPTFHFSASDRYPSTYTKRELQ